MTTGGGRTNPNHHGLKCCGCGRFMRSDDVGGASGRMSARHGVWHGRCLEKRDDAEFSRYCAAIVGESQA